MKKSRNLSQSSESGNEDDFALNEMNFSEDIIRIDPNEEEAINKFLKNDSTRDNRTLFDVIQDKIAQKQHDLQSVTSEVPVQVRDLHPDVIKMYKEVGELLAKYRSGKIPKAFKIIPNMVNWEQILE